MNRLIPDEPPGNFAREAPVVAIPVQSLSASNVVQPGSLPAGTALPVPPARRVAAELEWYWRVLAAIVGVGTLIYAFILAWRETTEGVATAAAFAVALVTLIFALAGVLPASVKVGDLEVKLQQAKEEGKEEGKEQGGLLGLKAGAAAAADIRSGRVQPHDVGQELKEALMSDKPLELHLHQATVQVPVPKVQDPKIAEAHAREVAASLENIS